MTNEPKKTVLGWTAQQQPQQPQPGHGYPPAHFEHHDTQPQATQLPEYLQPYAAPPSPYAQPQPQQPYVDPYAQQHHHPQHHPQQHQGYPQYQQQPVAPSYPQAPYPQQAHYGQVAPSYGYVQHAAAAAKAMEPQPSAKSSKSKPPKQGRSVAGADATAGVSHRVRFIRLTYLHLLLAILAFAGLEYLLLTNPTLVEKVSAPLFNFALAKRWNWAIVLGVFMAVSWVADYWASHATSRAMQYLGLGIYIVAEALIFVPLLTIVQIKTAAIIAKGGGDPNIIRDSAYVTLGIFGALTASVFISKKDFSFLRSGLVMASGAALMLILLSIAFGFNLGLVFSIAMVLLAAGYILYQTSQILAHYDPKQHVAAALALFSSVALMFWYVIRIFMRARE
ncbi:MAG TPA: Bax inhibitor-1 family protein [Kofleriaceae bacterium]|nr:Bax inhibitor-1 family protein [Kofleriaceae bacterium]